MARKPLVGTVAANVLEYSTGALNIDGCRVAGESTKRVQGEAEIGFHGGNFAPGLETGSELGRWPANLIHDGSDEVVALFPVTTSGAMKASTLRSAQDAPGSVCYGTYGGAVASADIPASSGSAARFFYCAKASRADRHAGMADPGPQFTHGATLRKIENTATTGNHHPTVKPTDLMAYLVRLVTPPGGIVLDPFMGSGSTGKAAMREGFRFIGCEMSPEYLAIAQARIEHELATIEAARLAAEVAAAPTPQFDLFA